MHLNKVYEISLLDMLLNRDLIYEMNFYLEISLL